ncbi:MAG: MerR family transcriptional regulator [Lachnospiraceae bacterium]|nr:MerR family transcriptional regulator [Lachnospiraceae bacterium]
MQETRYMISDASKMIDVKSHVLRYWEGELDLEISRNEMGNRYYRQEDIELLKSVKTLRDKGFELKAIKLLIPKMHKVKELDAKRLFDLRDKLNIALGLVGVKEQDTGAEKKSDEQKPDETQLGESTSAGLNNEFESIQAEPDVAAAREKEDVQDFSGLELRKESKMQSMQQKDTNNKASDSSACVKESEAEEREVKERESVEKQEKWDEQLEHIDETENQVHQIDQNDSEDVKTERKTESKAGSNLNSQKESDAGDEQKKVGRPEGKESVSKQRKEGDLKYSEDKRGMEKKILDARDEQDNQEAFQQTEPMEDQDIVSETAETRPAAVKDGHELMTDSQNEDKMMKFHQIMKEIVADAMKENGEQVAAKMTVQMTDVITETMIKELDYHMRVREEREEERFKQLDRTIREFQQQRQQVAATKDPKKKESKFFKKNKKRI